jgi:dihydroxy-acid dehydratase
MATRREQWRPPQPHFRRGYGWMFQQHVLQADQGCDFDFLRGGGLGDGPETPGWIGRSR